jgi:hypothetical protein
MMLLPLAHSLITYLVAMPGCPRGYLGPGGRRQDGEYSTEAKALRRTMRSTRCRDWMRSVTMGYDCEDWATS